MSGVGLVHLVYNALRDLPSCIQFINLAYGRCTLYQFREPYRSIQHVYEIAVCCRFLAKTWCSVLSSVGLVHLVYNTLRDLPVCILFIYTAYGSCTPYEFREPHRSLQHVYEIVVCCRLLAMTWCIPVNGVRLVQLVYNGLRDLPVCIQIYTQPAVVVQCTNLGNRTDPYNMCTRLLLAADCLLRPSVVP